jgi:hypothetical protein
VKLIVEGRCERLQIRVGREGGKAVLRQRRSAKILANG